MRYAPVVVFGYKRADMIENLFQSLERNKNVEKMDLFIFLDIPEKKAPRDIPLSEEVIAYVNTYKTISKFKNVEIRIAKQHKGLADSVISGVTEIINKYGKVIVLEDDLEVSHDFLDYMQRGLDFYENDKKIWAVAAHSPDLKSLKSYSHDVFLTMWVESLGWGTWKNRWNCTDWGASTFSGFQKDYMGRFLFNLWCKEAYKRLEKQMLEKNYDSWAVRWAYQQFRCRKYSVFPKESRVIHCGNDNRSTHGIYYSTQALKQNYRKCMFEKVQPDCRILLEYRKY